MRDPKTITSILATLALAACAVILTLKGDVQNALIFAVALLPNAGQLHPPPGITSSPILGEMQELTSVAAVRPETRGWVSSRVLVLLAGVALFVAACSWWTGGGGKTAVENAAGCVEREALAGRDVAAIGLACTLPIAKVLETLLTSTKPDVVAAPATREAREARRAMLAVDGGW